MIPIVENVRDVRERIHCALERSGRPGEEVAIVGVTKTFGPDVIEELIRAGIEDIGENRVQEFLAKLPRVGLPCRWHLVGTLQRNKASKVVGKVALIHSLDSVKLAETLDRLGRERGKDVSVLVQVNTSGEASKHGFDPGELEPAIERILELERIDVQGLMTIGPLSDDMSTVRRSFSALRELRDRLGDSLGADLPHLSMGMSDDFEVAIEEGATMVRLGRVLIGPRE